MTTANYLIEHNIKPSVQRVAVMDYLKEHKTHPTADEIFNALSPAMPTLSKTTVYNTLKLFTEQGAALCINIEEKNARFDGDVSQHAHFICLACGSIYDVFAKFDNTVSIKSFDGLTITQMQIYYKGFCKKCKENLNK